MDFFSYTTEYTIFHIMSVFVRPQRERVIGFYSTHGRDDQLPARLPARKDNPNLPRIMTSFSVSEIQQAIVVSVCHYMEQVSLS